MKQRKRPYFGSIKWRVFLGCTILIAIMLAVLWIFQTCFLSTFYKGIKTRQIQLGAQEIVKHINDENLNDRLETISKEKQLCIVITDETGYVLYSQEAWKNCILHRMNAVLYLRAYYITQEHGGTYLEQGKAAHGPDEENALWSDGRQKLTLSPETMLYTTITENKDGSARFIMLYTNLSPVQATVETLRMQLFWVTVLMIVLAFVLALILSHTITGPIRRINESAKQLAKGRYDTQFEEGGYQEIRELAQTLNYAAGELSKVEGLQRELVANISHDLRTPLTMIIGYAEVMRDLPGENTPENIQVIIDEATRLSTLVNDVLDISKLRSGTETMQVEVFNLTESIRQILQRYSKMTDYRITFRAEGDVWVKGDPLKLSQVVYNLVNNAITYTGKDKVVDICQTTAQGRVRISVTDTGEGIDPKLLNDIWDRYYKVDKAHKRAQIGTGLGLSIVKSILDLHPGTTYGVRSKLGEGSCFWFEMEQQPAPLPGTTE
ncbi:MAG: HAMP domain-containing sensor histidine kinase [Oscillospiraceae bacterium]|nr:HAMP domain-containing sensor histidine kinase [Oscillospiraceae bacterium]